MAGTELRVKKLHHLANKYLQEGKDDKALIPLSDLLNINMDDPQALYMMGVLMRNKGHCGLAAQLFRRCVALDPKAVNPWMFFGVSLHDIHAYSEAIQVFQQVKAMVPKEPQVYANISASYQQLGEFAEALNYANHALTIQPTNESATVVKAMASLAMGRWKDGFDGYRKLYGKQVTIRAYTPSGKEELPEWNGQKGQTVIIQGDQGLGDEIMFASVIEDAAKDAKLIYDCHPKLETVFRRSFPNIQVYGSRKDRSVPWLDESNAGARHHVSSLGRFYRIREKQFPRKPYLIPNPELMEKWRESLKDLPKPWVGIAWQGGIIGTMRETRSLDVEDWKPVIDQGGTFVDLSYHDSSAEVERFNAKSENKIVKFDLPVEDYDHTLALLAVLDLVVTVTTTVVHACGAIGKRALVLVPNMPAWRYGWRRDDMIWYPQDVKLFRQEREEPTMEPAIQRIAEEYAKSLHRV